MSDNKPLSKEDVIEKVFPDLIEYPHYALNSFQERAVMEAMDEWADIKVGEFISKQHSFTETTIVPKHILDEYAKQEAIGFFAWYGVKIMGFLQYIKDIRPIVTSNEIEEKIAEHELKSISELYDLYLRHKQQP